MFIISGNLSLMYKMHMLGTGKYDGQTQYLHLSLFAICTTADEPRVDRIQASGKAERRVEGNGCSLGLHVGPVSSNSGYHGNEDLLIKTSHLERHPG